MYLDNTSGGLQSVLSSGSADTAHSVAQDPKGHQHDPGSKQGYSSKSGPALQPSALAATTQSYRAEAGHEQTGLLSGHMAQPAPEELHAAPPAQAGEPRSEHPLTGNMGDVRTANPGEKRGEKLASSSGMQAAERTGQGKVHGLQREDSPCSDVSATSVAPMMRQYGQLL